MANTTITSKNSTTLDDLLNDSLTVDISNYNYITGPSVLSGYNGTYSSIGTTGSTGLFVSTNAQFEGDVTIKGVSILETLEKIEKRLSILRPDPKKLEHFEALRRAYEHYKTLEALCELPDKENE